MGASANRFNLIRYHLHSPVLHSQLCAIALVGSLGLAFLTLASDAYRPDLAHTLFPVLLLALCIALVLTLFSLLNVRSEHHGTDKAFRNADREFSSIFQNVLDGILIVDNEGCCLDTNPAAAGLLQLPADKLIGECISRFFAHPDVYKQNWRVFLQRKSLRGRMELLAGGRNTLVVDFTAVADYLPGRHLLIICDVTEQTRAELSLQKSEERFQRMASHAEIKIGEQLKVVDAARAEAEALRRATLALSRNLAMDSVLDTLLECISELIPYDVGTVLFVEEDADLLVARESPPLAQQRVGLTLASSENIFLQRVLFQKQALLLPDLAKHAEWRDIQPFDRIQSWLGVPLIAGGRVLGILSLGAYVASTLNYEYLRLAKSLAIPAAVAIENARVHERAEIYATELALRLEELRNAQNALGQKSRDGCNQPSPDRAFP